MKLLQTIRLDDPDTFLFETAAESGEWAVSGAFAFAHLDPAIPEGTARAAGFLGVDSLGWSTRVHIVEASREDRAAAVATLARQRVARFGAPDLASALPAAEEEIAFAASLSDHPTGMLDAVSRSHEAGSVHDVFRALRPSPPLRVFDVRQATRAEDAFAEPVDLLGMAKGECR